MHVAVIQLVVVHVPGAYSGALKVAHVVLLLVLVSHGSGL